MTAVPERGLSVPAGRLGFLVWTYVLGAAALLVATTLTFPVEPAIALPFSVAGIDPTALGVALWVGVGIATGTQAASDDGHAAIVYAVPSVVAAFALGGPTAAAWVALLGSTEWRELRGRVPWYGVLGNHAMVVVPGVLGGLVTTAIRGDTGFVADVSGLAAVLAGAAVFCALNLAMALAVVHARTGRGPSESLGVPWRTIAALLLGESAIAWVFAAAYVAIAWWSPALLVVAEGATSGSFERSRARSVVRRNQLTSLPNRLALTERAADLRRAQRSGVCVFYVDLDGFKAINDHYDHGVGDDVLREIGGRLGEATRGDDFLAHLHGDEFVMLAAGVATDEEAAAIARRLVAAVEPPIAHPRGELRVSASVGWRLVEDLDAFDDALRSSDEAMAREKRRRAAAGRRAASRGHAAAAAETRPTPSEAGPAGDGRR